MNMRAAPAAWRMAAIAHLPAEELSTALAGDDTAQWVEAAMGCGIAEAQLKLGACCSPAMAPVRMPGPPSPVFYAPRKAMMRKDMPCWDIAWKMAGAPKRTFQPPPVTTAAPQPWAMRAR